MMNRAAIMLGTIRAANLPTVVTNVAAAWLIAGGLERGGGIAFAWLTAGALLLYAGGSLLNDVIDVGFDTRNRPERAIPSGLLGLPVAWAGAAGMLVAGAVLCVVGGETSVVVTGVLVLGIVFYDVFHKKWRGAVLLMAACRVLLWCVAASSLGITPMVLWWAGLSGMFIVGISWIARRESEANARAPLAARALLLAPAVGIFYPSFELSGGVIVFAILFLASVIYALRIFRRDHPGRVKQGVEWLLAMIPLLDSMAVAHVDLGWAAILASGCVLCHCLQRWFAAS